MENRAKKVKEQMLDRLGVDHFEIRQKKDLEREFDALILPGGESTVMRKLLKELDLYDTIRQKIEAGMPVFGTCADDIYPGTLHCRCRRSG